MPKHFEVTTPRPLGHRHTVNQSDDAEQEKAFTLLAEKLAPAVAKLLEGEGKAPATNAGSNGRKLSPDDLVGRYTLPADDDYDTLPDGDAPGGASKPTDDYQLPD